MLKQNNIPAMPLRSVVLAILMGFLVSNAGAQCDPNVPSLVVDLSNSPTATYISPSTSRNGYCCGVTGNVQCIRFELTLHPDAQGFNFSVCEGAVPPGAMYYQVNCGPQIVVGTPICIDGPGPHIITFCKPGNNSNRYCITSIQAPSAGPPIALNEGCTGSITSAGFAPGSVQWTSVFPGPVGAYNNYLSCPTCPTTNVTGQAGYPAYVDYQVCGYAVSPCSQMQFCDTVRVHFFSTLTAVIEPAIPTVCFGATGTPITVVGGGGSPPYSYLWNTGATTAQINAGPGTYSVTLSDNSNCPPTTASVVVTQFMQPITAFAGADFVVCGASPVAQLNASVTGVTTGQWISGNGQFTPSNTALNATYTPTVADVNAGFVDLILMTTNNGTCPGHQDTVRVFFDPGIVNGAVAGVNATCNGTANGSASFTPADPTFTYLWNDPQTQTTATATGLVAGSYSVTVTNAMGCPITLPITIAQPDQVAISSLTVVNETCAGTGDGSITASVTGGTPPYSYVWNTAATGSTMTGSAGIYTVTITDANGCTSAEGTASIISNGQPNQANAGNDMIACSGEYPIALQGTVVNATGGTWSGGAGVLIGNGLNAQYHPTAAEIQVGAVTLTLTTTGNTACPAASDQVLLSLSNIFLNAALTATNVVCFGGANGSLSFSPVVPGSTYQWEGMPQETGPVVNDLEAGSYTLLVTDALGCSQNFTALLGEPSAMTIVDHSVTPESCAGVSDGTASILVEGGAPPFAYLWSPSAGGQTAVPATGLSPGWHSVNVFDSNGCTLHFEVNVDPAAPLVLTANVPGILCVNTTVELTATATGGTGAYLIDWEGIGTGPAVTHTFLGPQTIIVSVTDANNCPGPTLEFPVTVLDLSTATLNTYGDTTVCPGGSATVGAQLENYPGGYSIWWPQLGNTGNGPYTVPVTASTELQVYISDQCDQTLTGSIQVLLETPPSISLPPIIAQGCSPLTVNMPTDLTDAPVTYFWQLGNGITSTQQAPLVTYNSPGTYTVSLTVTTPAGCSASAQNTGQVIAYGSPAVSITASPWTTDIDNAIVEFTGQGAANVVSSFWTFGDGGTSNAVNPSHTYMDIGSYIVTLEVEDANGCTNEAITQVMITPVYDITVPNIFTPDLSGDGSGTYDPLDLSNDIFYPFVRYVDDYRMRIFNRWGELIFESNELSRGWNGYYREKLSPQDVYVYQLWVRFVDGKETTQLGDVTLMR